jgi:hypothetical protein
VNHSSSVENAKNGVKTEVYFHHQDKSGGNLITGQMAPGIKVA